MVLRRLFVWWGGLRLNQRRLLKSLLVGCEIRGFDVWYWIYRPLFSWIVGFLEHFLDWWVQSGQPLLCIRLRKEFSMD